MRLAELEEMMNEEPGEAERDRRARLDVHVEELSHIARNGRVHSLKLSAIGGLGEVGGPEATATLVELLEADTARPRVGGSEQKHEHEERQGRLVQSLARARGVPAPEVRTERDVEAFLESCRER